MKKTHLIAIAIALLFFSCQKTETPEEPQRSEALLEQVGKTLTFFKTDQEFTNQVVLSVERTFGKHLPYTITQVNNVEVGNKLIADVTYKTDKGESTLLIVTDLITKEKRIIDCTGSCQCRERLIVKPDGTEIYECTCDQCKMSITTVP